MAEERDDKEFGETEDKAGQQMTGQQGQNSEFGKEQSEQSTMSGQGGQSSGGQSSTGQSATGQSQSDSDTLITDRGSGAGGSSGQGGPQGEGFIGSRDSSGGASGSSDFANQGHGALDEDSEDESGTGSTGGGDSQ
jgi:hypothetical protein